MAAAGQGGGGRVYRLLPTSPGRESRAAGGTDAGSLLDRANGRGSGAFAFILDLRSAPAVARVSAKSPNAIAIQGGYSRSSDRASLRGRRVRTAGISGHRRVPGKKRRRGSSDERRVGRRLGAAKVEAAEPGGRPIAHGVATFRLDPGRVTRHVFKSGPSARLSGRGPSPSNGMSMPSGKHPFRPRFANDYGEGSIALFEFDTRRARAEDSFSLPTNSAPSLATSHRASRRAITRKKRRRKADGSWRKSIDKKIVGPLNSPRFDLERAARLGGFFS